eukprot:g7866.t1
MSSVLLGRQYSKVEWWLLLAIVIAVIAFQRQARVQKKEKSGEQMMQHGGLPSTSSELAGYTAASLAIFFSVLGSVLCEKFLKAEKKKLFCFQKMYIEAWAVVASVTLYIGLPLFLFSLTALSSALRPTSATASSDIGGPVTVLGEVRILGELQRSSLSTIEKGKGPLLAAVFSAKAGAYRTHNGRGDEQTSNTGDEEDVEVDGTHLLLPLMPGKYAAGTEGPTGCDRLCTPTSCGDWDLEFGLYVTPAFLYRPKQLELPSWMKTHGETVRVTATPRTATTLLTGTDTAQQYKQLRISFSGSAAEISNPDMIKWRLFLHAGAAREVEKEDAATPTRQQLLPFPSVAAALSNAASVGMFHSYEHIFVRGLFVGWPSMSMSLPYALVVLAIFFQIAQSWLSG